MFSVLNSVKENKKSFNYLFSLFQSTKLFEIKKMGRKYNNESEQMGKQLKLNQMIHLTIIAKLKFCKVLFKS